MRLTTAAQKSLFPLGICLIMQLFFVVLVATPVKSDSRLPGVMSYEGYITDTSGKPLPDGKYDFAFALYTNANGGLPIWEERHNNVPLRNGFVQLYLGKGTPPNPLDLPFDQQYFLGVCVGNEPEMVPRLGFAATPYSFRARVADEVPDGSITTEKLAPLSVADENIRSISWSKITDVPKSQDSGGGPQGGVPANVWSLFGNRRTDSTKDFLGTTDFQALILKTDNIERLRIRDTGEIDIKLDLNVGNDVTIGHDLDVGNDAAIGHDLSVGNNLDVYGLTHFHNGTESQNTSTGALIVDGGVGIGMRLNVGGNAFFGSKLTVMGDSLFQSNLDVQGSLNAGSLSVIGSGVLNGAHVAYFENTDGDNGDGIAIKIDTETSSENNFITFYKDSGKVAGRIEGFALPYDFIDIQNVPIPDPGDIVDFSNMFSVGSLPFLDIDIDWEAFDIDIEWNPGKLPFFDMLGFGEGNRDALKPLICWALANGFDSLISTNPFDLALAPMIIAKSNECKDGGVTYGSGGADYAEWLPKLDPEEKMSYGQIIGVHGGKVSRNTEGAEQIMAISTAPAVVGNIPPEGAEDRYAKVGFMGQVSVLVRGEVEIGDFILPSGRSDGIGIAISPDDLELEHLSQVLGRAWSESTNARMSMINVLISVKTNEWIEVMKEQQERIELLESRLESLSNLESKVEKLEALVDDLGYNDHRSAMLSE